MEFDMWHLLVISLLHSTSNALDNGLALTPPMGWLSWERFRCQRDCIQFPDTCVSEKLYMAMADRMVSDGYKDAGYEYVHIDDCWAASKRDVNGRLQADPVRFPSGIKALADYIHARGLKLGIYTDIGYATCMNLPGSEFYMQTDANTFAEWGVDLVKTDGCYADFHEMDVSYPTFGFFLNKTGRPIVYCCSWVAAQVVHQIKPDYQKVRQSCNVWRQYWDVQDSWQNILNIIDYYGNNDGNFANFSGPGGFSDPDELIVGDFGLSYYQQKAQFGLWAMLASPLFMSVDLRTINPQAKSILLNKRVIAINQDPLGQQAVRLYEGPAEELRQDVQSGTPLLKDKLSIELESDMRHGRVRYDNYIFNAKLVDLPCVVESLKTVDKKTFYKTADICQMLVCSTEDEVNVEDTDSPKKKDKDKKFLWNHGITPPLKNVRKRRFRKTLKKKYMDQPELEKEVRRLFRYDAEAIDVKWEVLTEDEKPLSDSGQTSGHIQASGTVSNADGTLRRQDTSGLDVASFFGELSSSDDEKDLNIMDSGEDDTSRGPFMQQIGEASMDRPASESQDIGGDADTEDLQEKLSELVQQLEEIRDKRLEMEAQMAEEDNDLMRDKLREDLERFLQEESQKEQEYEILSAMLNQG